MTPPETAAGEDAHFRASETAYDLVLLDVRLPGRSGIDVLRALRARGAATPVILLTARDAVEDRVHGLESGADDYLVKPFALAELIARVKVLTRRHRSRQGSVLSMADLRMDLEARRAWIGEQPLELSSREWAVLEYLLSRVGHVVGKEQILQAISGWDDALPAALAQLAGAPDWGDGIDAWASAAFAVRDRWRGDRAGRSISIPTWFYGHEPTNVFGTAIAKYFANALREDTLLHRCRGGIVFAPGAAGTVQEIFQAANDRYYATRGLASAPLVLLGVDSFLQSVVRGVIIVLAVLLNVTLSRKRGSIEES